MSQTWIEKPSILLTESKLLEFIPNNEMTYPEKLNALTRFIIATAIIIALIRRELFVLLIPLCCMVVIYFLTKWGLKIDLTVEDIATKGEFRFLNLRFCLYVYDATHGPTVLGPVSSR